MNQTSCDEQRVAILLKYFESARANILTRLAARDNCILLYFAAVAAIMTAAFTGGSPRYIVMLFIPIVSLAAAIFVAQHNFVMDTLYIYIATQIYAPLRRGGFDAIPWEVSPEYMDRRRYSTGLRIAGEAAVILFPAFFAIYSSFNAVERLLHGVGVTAFILTLIVIGTSCILAMKHLSELKKLLKGS